MPLCFSASNMAFILTANDLPPPRTYIVRLGQAPPNITQLCLSSRNSLCFTLGGGNLIIIWHHLLVRILIHIILKCNVDGCILLLFLCILLQLLNPCFLLCLVESTSEVSYLLHMLQCIRCLF